MNDKGVPALALVLLFFISACTVHHRHEIQVKNYNELVQAISQAMPCDQIVMSDGEWKDAAIDFNSGATGNKPVKLKAKTPGKVILSGQSKLTFSAPYLEAEGLLFTNGSPSDGNVVEFNSDYCRLTNSAIVDYNPADSTRGYYWIFFSGNHNRVDHCFFTGKNNYQPLIGNNQDDSRHNRVDSCHFKDIPYYPVNGREIFRIWGYGRSEELGDDGAYFTVESNLFERAHGEGMEIISFKSNRNIARNNTIIATKGGIVGRSGNFNTIEGNYISGEYEEGSSGIRLAGQGHKVINNYVTNVDGVGLSVMCGEYIEKSLTENYNPVLREGTPLGRVPRYGHIRNGSFSNNIFVNNMGTDIILGSSYKAGWPESQRVLIPENNTVSGNIVYKKHLGPALETPIQDVTGPLDVFSFQPNHYAGNVIYGGATELGLNSEAISFQPYQDFPEEELSKFRSLPPRQVGISWRID